MTTAFQTGPGFFAADSSDCDKTLPKDMMRFYCARIEAYDIPVSGDDPGHNTTFEILAAKGENDS